MHNLIILQEKFQHKPIDFFIQIQACNLKSLAKIPTKYNSRISKNFLFKISQEFHIKFHNSSQKFSTSLMAKFVEMLKSNQRKLLKYLEVKENFNLKDSIVWHPFEEEDEQCLFFCGLWGCRKCSNKSLHKS